MSVSPRSSSTRPCSPRIGLLPSTHAAADAHPMPLPKRAMFHITSRIGTPTTPTQGWQAASAHSHGGPPRAMLHVPSRPTSATSARPAAPTVPRPPASVLLEVDAVITPRAAPTPSRPAHPASSASTTAAAPSRPTSATKRPVSALGSRTPHDGRVPLWVMPCPSPVVVEPQPCTTPASSFSVPQGIPMCPPVALATKEALRDDIRALRQGGQMGFQDPSGPVERRLVLAAVDETYRRAVDHHCSLSSAVESALAALRAGGVGGPKDAALPSPNGVEAGAALLLLTRMAHAMQNGCEGTIQDLLAVIGAAVFAGWPQGADPAALFGPTADIGGFAARLPAYVDERQAVERRCLQLQAAQQATAAALKRARGVVLRGVAVAAGDKVAVAFRAWRALTAVRRTRERDVAAARAPVERRLCLHKALGAWRIEVQQAREQRLAVTAGSTVDRLMEAQQSLVARVHTLEANRSRLLETNKGLRGRVAVLEELLEEERETAAAARNLQFAAEDQLTTLRRHAAAAMDLLRGHCARALCGGSLEQLNAVTGQRSPSEVLEDASPPSSPSPKGRRRSSLARLTAPERVLLQTGDAMLRLTTPHCGVLGSAHHNTVVADAVVALLYWTNTALGEAREHLQVLEENVWPQAAAAAALRRKEAAAVPDVHALATAAEDEGSGTDGSFCSAADDLSSCASGDWDSDLSTSSESDSDSSDDDAVTMSRGATPTPRARPQTVTMLDPAALTQGRPAGRPATPPKDEPVSSASSAHATPRHGASRASGMFTVPAPMPSHALGGRSPSFAGSALFRRATSVSSLRRASHGAAQASGALRRWSDELRHATPHTVGGPRDLSSGHVFQALLWRLIGHMLGVENFYIPKLGEEHARRRTSRKAGQPQPVETKDDRCRRVVRMARFVGLDGGISVVDLTSDEASSCAQRMALLARIMHRATTLAPAAHTDALSRLVESAEGRAVLCTGACSAKELFAAKIGRRGTALGSAVGRSVSFFSLTKAAGLPPLGRLRDAPPTPLGAGGGGLTPLSAVLGPRLVNTSATLDVGAEVAALRKRLAIVSRWVEVATAVTNTVARVTDPLLALTAGAAPPSAALVALVRPPLPLSADPPSLAEAFYLRPAPPIGSRTRRLLEISATLVDATIRHRHGPASLRATLAAAAPDHDESDAFARGVNAIFEEHRDALQHTTLHYACCATTDHAVPAAVLDGGSWQHLQADVTWPYVGRGDDGVPTAAPPTSGRKAFAAAIAAEVSGVFADICGQYGDSAGSGRGGAFVAAAAMPVLLLHLFVAWTCALDEAWHGGRSSPQRSRQHEPQAPKPFGHNGHQCAFEWFGFFLRHFLQQARTSQAPHLLRVARSEPVQRTLRANRDNLRKIFAEYAHGGKGPSSSPSAAAVSMSLDSFVALIATQMRLVDTNRAQYLFHAARIGTGSDVPPAEGLPFDKFLIAIVAAALKVRGHVLDDPPEVVEHFLFQTLFPAFRIRLSLKKW